jgi:hypothetical protein
MSTTKRTMIQGSDSIDGALTLRLEVIRWNVLGPSEDFTPIIAQRIHTGLDAKPAEVSFQRSRDVRLSPGYDGQHHTLIRSY